MLATFTGTIAKEPKSGWTCVFWPGSVTLLGTGKPVRVKASVDSHSFEVTLMPAGGFHMVPLKAGVRKLLGKQEGDSVEVVIQETVIKKA
ncbi:hypothetical protein BH11PAT4_BH11PAT4_8870 [soil metagenome]